MALRDYNMDELDSKQDNTISFAKTHEEILEMIEEIKKFEKKFIGHDFEETEVEFIAVDKDVVEFIEVEENKLEQFEPISIKQETKKPGLKEKLKISKIFKARPKVQKEEVEAKPITAATFKIRFNEAGELVNIDLKKPKPRPESKKRFDLKKIMIIRKGKTEKKEKAEETEKEAETTEKKSKISNLKGGLGKISLLKKAIPHRRKKKEET
jgi:hypothetical protein